MVFSSRTLLLPLTTGLPKLRLQKISPKWLTRDAHVQQVISTRDTCVSTVSQIPVCRRIGNSQFRKPLYCSHQNILSENATWRIGSSVNFQQHRYYRLGRISHSTAQKNDKSHSGRTTPELMDFPWIIWPNLWLTIRNWIYANLMIRRYLDNEFSLVAFKKGSIMALTHVSRELSQGNFEALGDLVTKPSLEEIKKNFSLLSVKQRLDLAVEEEDIFFSFPYQIGIIFTNESGQQERIFVEITMCYHVFRGFQDYLAAVAGSASDQMKTVYKNADRISIANYRFIREYTKGVEDQWTVTLANHFKPGEVIHEP